MLSPERLETYMRRAAMLGRETVEVPPFVCFFSPGDPLRFFNYAKPLRPVGAEPDGLTDSLAALANWLFARATACRASSSSRSTRPTWGRRWSRRVSTWKNAIRCWSARRRRCDRAPPIPGLTITTLTPDSPAEDLLACLTVQREGFGEIAGDPPTQDDVDDLRANLAEDGAFLARVDGVPAGAMMFTAPLDGLTELAGGTTIEAYRRRGIGAAMIAAAAAAAFDARRGDRLPDRGQRIREWCLPAGRLRLVRNAGVLRGAGRHGT